MAYSIDAKDYFKSKLYTGNGSNSHAITGVGFEPSFVWIKDRTNSYDHCAFDQPRGVSQRIYPNNAQAQSTDNDNLVSFDSDGFTVDDNGITNANSNNFVSWNWKANGQGSSNTAGSINTTYTSVDASSGVSISTYTGNGSAGATIGHGLGVVPKVMLVKRLNASGQWDMYHSGLSDPKSGSIVLNSDANFASDSSIWNNTDPTNSLVTLGTSSTTNTNGGTYVIYCFAQKSGFSNFGSYSGNSSGSNGAFIYTGFKPSLIIGKYIGANYDWWMLDTARNPSNVANLKLYPNTSAGDATGVVLDMYSNGFKMYDGNQQFGQNGSSYIYLAWAAAPLVGTNDIPANAK
tara:strand:- start:44 stop:1084 length:1041 start_codon:yes stop_codon:yes gene_type:complete